MTTGNELSRPESAKLAQRELHRLAHTINEREKNITVLRANTESAAGGAVSEAILQGQDLIRAKSMMRHGLWEGWLKSHCPQISDRTSRAYMRVARNQARLGNASSIRQALMLTSESHTSSSSKHIVPADLQLLTLAMRITKFESAHPIAEAPQETKEKLAVALEPLARVLWPAKFEKA